MVKVSVMKMTLALAGLLAAVNPLLAADPAPATNAVAKAGPPPKTSREFFNAGTQKLQEKKWAEAESFLQTALDKQTESIQPAALYNLGHVRFLQGVEELKKSLQAGPTAARGRNAAQQATEAVRRADDALASGEVPKMVEAYMQGRGVRREMKSAKLAVTRALEMHGVVLRRWQRALSDFKSALELNPTDADAQENVKTVERAIAKLIDMIEELQQAMAGMGKPDKDLGDKMKELRGQIPAPDMPPGASGDEDEEDDERKPSDPKDGKDEGPNRTGREVFLTPEEAGWLLDRLKPGGERRLPMGQGDEAVPKDRRGRNW